MIYIGIDPGKSGSIAFIPDSGRPWTIKLDGTLADIASSLSDAEAVSEGRCFAVLEIVHSSPQMGVKSAFSFGQSLGQLEMLLTCLRIPFERIRPQEWQKEMKCLTKGDKNVTKARAQELFPNIKITHANADSLLIAEFCRRRNTNKP